MKIRAALKTKVVIPMLMPVHRFRAYEIELIGVVPKVDLIEKATPKAIMNNPKTKRQILLIITNFIWIKLFKLFDSKFQKISSEK